VLAIVVQRSSTIDWLNHYMVLPIAEPIDVCTGDKIRISFQYRTGGSIPLLQNAIQVQLDSEHQAMSFERRALMVA
jgi:type I protein arginine methyltransferase